MPLLWCDQWGGGGVWTGFILYIIVFMYVCIIIILIIIMVIITS